MNFTRELVRQNLSYTYDNLPEDVREIAKLCILDSLGCAIRGVKEDLFGIMSTEISGRHLSVNELLFDRPQEMRPSDHAMLVAAAGHAIDFDDTLAVASTHAGSLVTGTLLSLIQNRKVTGEDAICSIVAGYETAVRIADNLTEEHSTNGMHCTGTIGVFSATATASRLLNLDTEQSCQAFGLAATQAAGMKCSFGTMAKPFNAAHAASSGVMAASLVARGFTASNNALENHRGYFRNLFGKPTEQRQLKPETYFGIRFNLFKLHAACHEVHPVLNAIDMLREEEPFDVSDIDRFEIITSPYSLEVATVTDPSSALETKFSFQQTAASSLAGMDMSASSTYSGDILNNTKINELRKKVAVTARNDLKRGQAEIRLLLRNRKPRELTYDGWKLFPKAVEQKDQLRKKFINNTGDFLDEPAIHDLLTKIESMDHAPDLSLHLMAS